MGEGYRRHGTLEMDWDQVAEEEALHKKNGAVQRVGMREFLSFTLYLSLSSGSGIGAV